MNSYFRDRLILVSLLVSLVLNIVLWLVLAGKFGSSTEPIPLHFNVVYGIDFVGNARLIYQLPAVGLTVLIINFYLGQLIYQRQKLFSYFLNFTHLLVQIVLFVAGAVLVILNS